MGEKTKSLIQELPQHTFGIWIMVPVYWYFTIFDLIAINLPVFMQFQEKITNYDIYTGLQTNLGSSF